MEAEIVGIPLATQELEAVGDEQNAVHSRTCDNAEINTEIETNSLGTGSRAHRFPGCFEVESEWFKSHLRLQSQRKSLVKTT